jgi:hypothetical protein
MYTTYKFSTTIGPHVCGSRDITKQNKIEKLCNADLQNLLLFNMVVVFIEKYYYAFIVKQMQKKHIF